MPSRKKRAPSAASSDASSSGGAAAAAPPHSGLTAVPSSPRSVPGSVRRQKQPRKRKKKDKADKPGQGSAPAAAPAAPSSDDLAAAAAALAAAADDVDDSSQADDLSESSESESSGEESEEEEEGEGEDETAPAPAPAPAAPARAPRTTVSAADADYRAGNLVCLHVDIEHNGHAILQISGVAREKLPDGSFGPRPGCPGAGQFNRYIKPPPGCPWGETQSKVHGLSASSPEIKNADALDVVWKDFVEWCEGAIGVGIIDRDPKRGVLVAWGGKACDVEWFFRTTEWTTPTRSGRHSRGRCPTSGTRASPPRATPPATRCTTTPSMCWATNHHARDAVVPEHRVLALVEGIWQHVPNHPRHRQTRRRALVAWGVSQSTDSCKLAEDRPGWMRKHEFVPCDCTQCHLCTSGITHGVAHFVRPDCPPLRGVTRLCPPPPRLTRLCCCPQTSPGLRASAGKKRRAAADQSASANADSHSERETRKSQARCHGCKVGLDKVNKGRAEAAKWNPAEVQRTRKSCRTGCPGCNVPICDDCWGDDGKLWDHVNKCSKRTDFARVKKKVEVAVQ